MERYAKSDIEAETGLIQRPVTNFQHFVTNTELFLEKPLTNKHGQTQKKKQKLSLFTDLEAVKLIRGDGSRKSLWPLLLEKMSVSGKIIW